MKKLIFVIIAALMIGCSGNEKGGSKEKRSISITKKDNLTPADQGGYGFEKISKSLGYESYIWSEAVDGTYFGDPNAKKGGTLNYTHSLFPRTMRVIGQNSSQVLNSRTIMALCYES